MGIIFLGSKNMDVLNRNTSFLYRIVDGLVQFSVFLTGSLALTIPSGYCYGPALLLVVSFMVCWQRWYWSNIPGNVKVFMLILVFYFLVQAISIYLDNGTLREFDRPSRSLMAAFILPLLCHFPVRAKFLISGFSLGACIAGMVACYDFFYLNMPRAFDDAMPIQSGDISMTLGLLCLCASLWYKKNAQLKMSFLMLLPFCLGVLGSFLSGARGGWILLPIIIFTIITYFYSSLNRTVVMTFLTVVIIFVVIVALPQTGVMSRLYAANDDINKYVSGENLNTSVGVRLQLWNSAWRAFKDKPVFGWGNNGIRDAQRKQFETGQITKFIYDFNSHAHNQFLDELSKRGLIGFISLILLFYYPFLIYRRSARSDDLPALSLGVCVMSFFDYSLTQAFLNHNSGAVFVPVMLSVFISKVSKNS